MSARYVVPILGRAGLGNELFAIARSLEIAEKEDRELLWPTWFQLRIGPLLRRERDPRLYWLTFRGPSPRQLILRVLGRIGGVGETARHGRERWVLVSGMRGRFRELSIGGEVIREALEARARRSAFLAPSGAYLAIHVRLGDFARPETDSLDDGLTRNNTSSPMGWFVEQLDHFRRAFPAMPVYVCSDGSDAELHPLLSLPGVQRSPSRDALEELIFMSRAAGILGSRSTFSAWGAFLGSVPLLVAIGGNEYTPHSEVWEAGQNQTVEPWTRAVQSRVASQHG